MMLRVMLLFLASAASGFVTAQTASMPAIEFGNKADYKLQEKNVAEMARYVLSNPLSDSDPDRTTSLQNIVKWMSGTPDHNFVIDASISKLIKNNEDLLGLYMASMTQYALRNNGKTYTDGELKLGSFQIMLAYCRNQSNGVRMTKELKKAIESDDRGELEKYLRL